VCYLQKLPNPLRNLSDPVKKLLEDSNTFARGLPHYTQMDNLCCVAPPKKVQFKIEKQQAPDNLKSYQRFISK
jgi:hypothetical protein